jgi:secretion/DNA translocation related TadE-like protein
MSVEENRPSDSGMATVGMVGFIAALMALIGGLFWYGAAVVTRHEVVSAADLSALAAAGQAELGEREACEQAAWVTRQMAMNLRSCRLEQLDVLVEVSAETLDFLPFPGVLSARARAGP